MELLVIRHGLAEDGNGAVGQKDARRPLTKRGRRKMRRAVGGLAALVPDIDVIASSPYLRSMQTADIIAAAYDGLTPEQVRALSPGGSRDEILAWLQERGENETVAVVGHEPHLGLLASWLLAAPLNHFLALKKGGAVLLGWPDYPAAGNAWLRWALTPGQLKKLGKA